MANIFQLFSQKIKKDIASVCEVNDFAWSKITVELSFDEKHGDITTNAALVLARSNNIPPATLAHRISIELSKRAEICDVNIVNGHLNLVMTKKFWKTIGDNILEQGNNFGKPSKCSDSEMVNVEYVSANPTGPLHLGHARNAIIGDVIANLYEFCGHKVSREYYVNDCGYQAVALARSVYWRYLEEAATNQPYHFSELNARTITYANMTGLYPGKYLKPIGAALWAKYGNDYVYADEDDWLDIFKKFSVKQMLLQIKQDLGSFHIKHDKFIYESDLIARGTPNKAIKILKEKGYVYTGKLPHPKGKQQAGWEAKEQLLFRSTDFGDDVDRAIKRADGVLTYFGGDIANHYDKYQRGFKKMVNIFGVDHSGYAPRLSSVVKLISNDEADLKIVSCALVLYSANNKSPERLSKRLDNVVGFDDLIQEVGNLDSIRINMIDTKSSNSLEFCWNLYNGKDLTDKVFAIKYAHARTHSLEQMFAEQFPHVDKNIKNNVDFKLLNQSQELQLLKKLCQWPQVVEGALQTLEPHRIVFYTTQLSHEFHSLWNQGNADKSLRFIVSDNLPLTYARIGLSRCVRYVLQASSKIIGFAVPNQL